MRNGRPLLASALCLSVFAICQSTQAIAAVDRDPTGNVPTVTAHGTISMPPIQIPLSEHLSPKAAEEVAEYFNVLNRSAREKISYSDASYVTAFFARGPVMAAKLYPTKMSESEIAGVKVRTYLPPDGRVNDEQKILINLHGGGFSTGWPNIADEESMPVANQGHYRVVSIDYRQSPDHFPAASQDVASVYRELLKTHRPEKVGIYGCSAGGFLVAESLAWFQRNALPKPGAVGIFCASAGGYAGGDSDYLSGPLIGMASEDPLKWGSHRSIGGASYFEKADFQDPLVAPIVSDSTLSWFPPTLILTSTRAGDMSGAVFTHSKLVSLGVDAELNIWEGLPHGFFTFMPDLPESHQAVSVIVKFFDKHLGEKRRPQR